MSFLGFPSRSTRLGPEVSCPRTLPGGRGGGEERGGEEREGERGVLNTLFIPLLQTIHAVYCSNHDAHMCSS